MKTQWISITDRLPRPYVRVLTVLFNGDKWLIVNSVQNTSIQQADGTQVDVIQWEEHNIEVTHWLEGIPAIPHSPQLTTDGLHVDGNLYHNGKLIDHKRG